MQRRRRFREMDSLKDRLIQQSRILRKQAGETPGGVQREELLRKARQAEVAAHLDDWLSSPGLQSPD
jgi:hypothetical protein